MKERIIIVFVAVFVGLVITTIGFFIYESTKALPRDKKISSANSSNKSTPTPQKTPTNKLFLTIDEPPDEGISDKRTIQIRGKTNSENVIIISSNAEDVLIKPTKEGSFSTTVTIDAQVNKLIIRAIGEDGEEIVDERVITFTTEEF